MSAQAVGQLDGSDFAPSGEAKKSEQRTIAIDDIKLSGENMRIDMGDLTELADSIRERGVLQPLLVEDGADGYLLVAGHRRLAAARRAGLRRIPCTVRPAYSDDGARLSDMLAENLHRRNLSPLEAAHAVKRLVDSGRTQAEVAVLLGKGQTYVSNHLKLLTLPPEDQDAVHQGTVGLQTMLARHRNPSVTRAMEKTSTGSSFLRWQGYYIDRLVAWLESGNIPLHVPAVADKLNMLWRTLATFVATDDQSGEIRVQKRRCRHPRCITLLSRSNDSDYCGAHEREHV